MANTDQRFEEFRYDFISHLAARFDISPEVVATRLGEWLLDRKHDDRRWQQELASADRSAQPRNL